MINNRIMCVVLYLYAFIIVYTQGNKYIVQ